MSADHPRHTPSDRIFGRVITTLHLGPRSLTITRGRRVELYVALGPEGDRATRFVCGLDSGEVDALVDALRAAQAEDGRSPGRPQQRDDEARAPGSPPTSWQRAAASGVAGAGAPTTTCRPPAGR